MKRVSFKVAKAIKTLGFHDATNHFYSDGYDDEDNPKHEFVLCGASIPTFVQDWNDTNKHPEYDKTHIDYWRNVWSAPTYLDVWLWLCNKGIVFYPAMYSAHNPSGWSCYYSDDERIIDLDTFGVYNNIEDAIIASIDYLVENDLIKFIKFHENIKL